MILRMGVIATSEVVSELNSRNYYLQTTTTTPATSPPVSKPVISRSTYIDYAVQMALQHYNLSATASSRTYLASTTWNALVSTAVEISRQLDQQYTVSGLNGLRMSGCCPSVGRLGETWTYNPTYDNPQTSWGSTWGPVIMQMIGAAMTIGGTYWQQQITRQALEQQYLQTTGQQLGVPTQQDVNSIAAQLARLGLSQEQISQILSSAVPTVQPKSELPSWLLPVAIGVGAMALLRR